MNVKKDLESHVKANLALLHLQHLHPLLLALLLLQLLDQPLNARYCLLLVPHLAYTVSFIVELKLKAQQMPTSVGTAWKRSCQQKPPEFRRLSSNMGFAGVVYNGQEVELTMQFFS